MPLLQRQVADYPTDDTPTKTHAEWINPDQIESVAGHVTWNALDPVLWLELSMTSGAVRFILAGPVLSEDLTEATSAAVHDFLLTR